MVAELGSLNRAADAVDEPNVKQLPLVFLVLLVACGSGAGEGASSAGAGSGIEQSDDCDTAFVFDAPQPPSPVLEALRDGEIEPVEVRFSTEGAGSGATGGAIGSPGYPSTVDFVESRLEMIEEAEGVEPSIIGVRVSDIVGEATLGPLAARVHTRTVVPVHAAVAMVPPDVDDDPIKVVQDPGGC